jgi:hypothetical protein
MAEKPTSKVGPISRWSSFNLLVNGFFCALLSGQIIWAQDARR